VVIFTAIVDLLNELRQDPYEYAKIEHKDDAFKKFEKEYARASLMNRSSLDWTEWRKYYKNATYPRITIWSEDGLDDLLRKIDFNIEGFSKALVRVAGIAVCLAGAAGKSG
jgi:hypothetical protein